MWRPPVYIVTLFTCLLLPAVCRHAFTTQEHTIIPERCRRALVMLEILPGFRLAEDMSRRCIFMRNQDVSLPERKFVVLCAKLINIFDISTIPIQ